MTQAAWVHLRRFKDLGGGKGPRAAEKVHALQPGEERTAAAAGEELWGASSQI